MSCLLRLPLVIHWHAALMMLPLSSLHLANVPGARSDVNIQLNTEEECGRRRRPYWSRRPPRRARNQVAVPQRYPFNEWDGTWSCPYSARVAQFPSFVPYFILGTVCYFRFLFSTCLKFCCAFSYLVLLQLFFLLPPIYLLTPSSP